MSNRLPILTPTILLRAYAAGVFPMAESAQSRELRWYDPPVRAIIPLDDRFHVPRRLARTVRRNPYQVTVNKAFADVMQGCAAPTGHIADHGRDSTWINRDILRLYTALHHRGHAHSVEIWRDKNLVGGLYGVSLGRAFFGESMFSRDTDASKIALVHLVALLRHCGYTLLDTQFQTDHLARFGTVEITRDIYQHLLAGAIKEKAALFPAKPDWAAILATPAAPDHATGQG
ncbi:MAG: leucyl/phenylalanyl-tRNA--protein transferase [Alphaproteobacteria bacterium]|nr:leucyl/phenylalanyl-tRNA--protein transferase [Alphaproteobacteria bacterium]